MKLISLNRKLGGGNFRNLSRNSQNSKAKSFINKKVFTRILIILIILGIFIGIPLQQAYTAAKSASVSAKKIAEGMRNENLDAMKAGVIETRKSVEALDTSLKFLIWIKLIPFAGSYYSDAKHFSAAGVYELRAAETALTTLEPYKNELGLAGTKTPGQDKVAQAVKMLEKIIPQLDKIEPDLKKARQEVENMDVNKYPETFKGIVIKNRVIQGKELITGVHVAVTEARDAIMVAPDALGSTTPKTYLILFQNDKEIRATGGFLTAYAFLKLDKGHISTTGSDDIYRLDETLLAICQNKICPLTPPAPIVKYLPEFDGKPRGAWSLRDSNLSPDLSVSMQDFEKMYRMIEPDLAYDGIITIDTQVVEEMISLTGSIDVFGTIYSSETDKRCNCPNVIYELEKYAEITSKGEGDRKAILGTLMQQLLARSLTLGTDRMLDLMQTTINLANHKHIMVYMHDAKTQSALTKLGWTGQIKVPEGDYLHINDSNFAGGKTNLYVEQTVIYNVNTTKDKPTVKLTIEYKNPQPFGTWLNTINRDYVRIYLPTGSKLTTSKGSDDPVNTKEDTLLNKTYFEAFVTVRPLNSRKLEFEYELPFKISGKEYPLLIQKQPGAKDHKYTVKVNGKTQQEFLLEADRKLNLSI